MRYFARFVLFSLFSFSSFHILAQSDEINLIKSNVLFNQAQERDRQVAEELESVKSKRIRIEEDLLDARENPSAISKNEKRALEDELKTFTKKEKVLEKKREQTLTQLTNMTELLRAEPKKRAKIIEKYEKANGLIQYDSNIATAEKPASNSAGNAEFINPSQNISNNPMPESNTKGIETADNTDAQKPKKKPVTEGGVRAYDPQQDVMQNPPPPDCQLAFDGIDKFTGKRKKETIKNVFFKHTDDFMRAAMQGKDYITCEATVSWVQGGYYYLNLYFTIQTKEAQRAFGFLDKGSPITFKLISGKNVVTTNSKTDIGTVDMVKGTTTYRAQIQLVNSEVRNLTDSELDIVRVSWSAGYEDYEIYNIDYLINAFRCLDRVSK